MIGRIKEGLIPRLKQLYENDDWLANYVGILFFLISFIPGIRESTVGTKDWIINNPLTAFPTDVLIGISVALVLIFIFSFIVILVQRQSKILPFLFGFTMLLFLSLFAQFLGSNKSMKKYGLRYAVWSLIFGLLVSNLVSLFTEKPPEWVSAGGKGNFFIKCGLVLMGVDDIKVLLRVGASGLFTTWIPTPLLIIIGFLIGVYIFKLRKDFTLILVAGTMICGESAAMAISSTIKGKSEDLAFVISLIAITVIPQLIIVPIFISAVGMDSMIAGSWVGSSVDTTGAVIAVCEILGGKAQIVGPLIKIIQNLLIGFVAVGVAFYWSTQTEGERKCPSPLTLYDRFPKFVFGYLLLIFTTTIFVEPFNAVISKQVISFNSSLSKFFFTMGFVGIGLENSILSLWNQMKDTKSILFYILIQFLDFGLKYLFSWIGFGGVIWKTDI